jgi:GT2 family glycosyltransferase
MRASVVIPTYERLLDLKRVLAAVEQQALPASYELEIVIVDDGSRDGTGDWLRAEGDGRGWVVVHQDNAGPATARNRGVAAAAGDLVLFLGDDTEPQPGWLATHLEEHRLFGGEGPLAVLGYTSFAEALETPFLRFINEYGAQFGYQLIDDPCSVPFNFFYTSNISLPRRLLTELGGFREDFPAAAWEDIELAYRGRDAGLVLRYQPRARTVHHHCVRPGTFCRRQRTSGRSAAIFAELHPELRHFLGIERLPLRRSMMRVEKRVLGALVALGERFEGLVPGAVYQRFLDDCYLQGLAEGLHSR